MTEQQLIAACRNGEAYAQQVLFSRYCDPLFVVCIRYIPVPADAEEVLSDVFAQAFRSLHRFEYRGEGSFRAWITKIAVYACLQFLRKRKTFRFSPLEDPVTDPEDGEADGIAQLQAKELLRLIHSMPPGYSAVFNLYVVEGYNHKEIAALLGISEATSKTQLMKAKAFLRKKLQADEKRT